MKNHTPNKAIDDVFILNQGSWRFEQYAILKCLADCDVMLMVDFTHIIIECIVIIEV